MEGELVATVEIPRPVIGADALGVVPKSMLLPIVSSYPAPSTAPVVSFPSPSTLSAGNAYDFGTQN